MKKMINDSTLPFECTRTELRLIFPLKSSHPSLRPWLQYAYVFESLFESSKRLSLGASSYACLLVLKQELTPGSR